MPTRWEHFEHQADIGVRGYGPTVEDAFEAAATALTAVIVAPEQVATPLRVEVTARSADRELLLAAWLNAIIFEMATRRALFSRFSVRITADGTGDRLYGVLEGEAVDVARHQPAVEIKGATYTALKVVQVDGGWIAQCVVDV
ncbi:MAG: archease [Nitrospirota bacterium]|nr:archease [Nitrospirota bacterium]